MKINNYNFIKYKILIIFFILCSTNNLDAQKAYFDLSQDEIRIDTNFKGQELILFGLTESDHDIIIIVRGPKEDLTIRNKKRILGFWFNINSIEYISVPKKWTDEFISLFPSVVKNARGINFTNNLY